MPNIVAFRVSGLWEKFYQVSRYCSLFLGPKRASHFKKNWISIP